jgi:Ca-activated chloride channel family protein
MKNLTSLLTLLLFVSFSSIMKTATAQQAAEEDKTLSPYFVVNGKHPGVDALPLKSTGAEVNIAGVIADVTVTQRYKNEGITTLEAVYVFPTSTRAAVYGMEMKIGERTIVAEIRERAKARTEYEQAKSEGKRTSLLEQERPNVFTMNVANIKPGDEIEVILHYTEMLVATEGEYEFVYPTVVGPRYSNQPAETVAATDKFVATPYTTENKMPRYAFNMLVKLSTGVPLQQLTSSSHKTNIKYNGLSNAIVTLSPVEKEGGNRAFILNYKLAGKEIESGLLLYEGEEENFFMMMVQPPKRVEPKDIPAREFIFIVDVSGSMMGFALETTKKLLRDLITNLKPGDKFNMLLFAGSTGTLSPTALDANEANITRAIDYMDEQSGGGGTELLPALEEALALPSAENISRSMVIITDGYINVEHDAFQLMRENLDEANMFSFGIGSSVNRYLIEGMARVGKGEPMIVTQESEAYEQADKFRKYVSSPVLTKVKVSFSGFDAYDLDPVSVPDVLAARPVVIFGKYRGEAKGSITLRGQAANKRYKKSFNIGESKPTQLNAALKYLWAREKIKSLDDYGMMRGSEAIKKEVTELGLKYNLMTAHTSFIAVDNTPAEPNADLTKVNQALPLPQGVTNNAVGFEINIAGVTIGKKSKRQTANEEVTLNKYTNLNTIEGSASADVYDLLKELTNAQTASNKNLTFELTLDEDGNVTAVKLISGKLKKKLLNKLLARIQELNYGEFSTGVSTTFEIQLSK